jgi:hypothetical protein
VLKKTFDSLSVCVPAERRHHKNERQTIPIKNRK